MKIPSKAQLQRLREIYKPGTIVELTSAMDDPYHPLPAGMLGVVQDCDDAGQLLVAWSDGSTLSLIPGVDRFRIVEESPNENAALDES